MTNDIAKTLLSDPDPMVRRAAADGLSQAEYPSREASSVSSVIETLVSALSDPHIAVQQAAANALLTYDPQPVSEHILPLLHGGVQHRSIAVDILYQLGSVSIPCLLQAIDDPDPHIRKFIADILGHIGCPSSGAGLLRLLTDSDPNVRASAAEALGQIGGFEAVAGLMAAVFDEEEWVVFSVIQALGQLRAPQATGLLCEYLESEKTALQCAVVEALGKIGDPRVLPDLLNILPTAGIPLRHLLFATLAGLVGNQSEVFQRLETSDFLFAELVAALRSREPEIQLAALKGIRLMGNSKATGALLEYLGNCGAKEDVLQAAALVTLTEIGDEAQLMRAALDSEESVALLCIKALSSRHVAHAIPMLGELVAHSDNREVRRAALIALGQLGIDDCEQVLIDALNDHCGFVRSEAARVIARTKVKSAHGVLLKRLNEEHYPDVIVELVQTLIDLKNDENVQLLQTLLSHTNPEVRAAVASQWVGGPTATVRAMLLQHHFDEDWRVRLSIVEKLSSQPPSSILFEAFIQAMSDPHPYVRQASVIALGDYDLASIKITLYRALRSDPDMWVRMRCVEQLIKMDDRSGSTLMRELLPTVPVPVQMVIARALGSFKDPLAIEILEPLLSDDCEDLRKAASWALGQINGSSHQMAEV